MPCGEEVAGHLSHLVSRFGPPLFCKRDNGGNLNHMVVDEVLADALVVPINNPANTAFYNGAIEHTQGEFKAYLRRWDWKTDTGPKPYLIGRDGCSRLESQAPGAVWTVRMPAVSILGASGCVIPIGNGRRFFAGSETLLSRYQTVPVKTPSPLLHGGRQPRSG